MLLILYSSFQQTPELSSNFLYFLFVWIDHGISSVDSALFRSTARLDPEVLKNALQDTNHRALAGNISKACLDLLKSCCCKRRAQAGMFKAFFYKSSFLKLIKIKKENLILCSTSLELLDNSFSSDVLTSSLCFHTFSGELEVLYIKGNGINAWYIKQGKISESHLHKAWGKI